MSTWRERIKILKDEEKYYRGTYLSGSKLDNFFDLLRIGEYAAGGVILRHRQIKAIYGSQWANLRLPATIGEGVYSGIKHRISPSKALEVEGFWTSLAVDTAFDPTTYTGYGVWKLLRFTKKGIPKAAKHVIPRLPEAAQKPITKAGTKLNIITDALGEAFVPGYWLKKLPGKYGEYFGDYLDWVLRKKGATLQAFHELKVMAHPFKKRGAEITKYIESGVDTGDKALNKYIDEVIKPYIAAMREAEIVRGIDVGEVAGYVHHTLTKQGKKFVEEMGGMPEVIKYYAQKVRAPYAEERTLKGTIEEINKGFGFDFFEPDFWKATAIRSKKHVADIYTADWFKHVQEKYGIDELSEAVGTGIGFVKSTHPQIGKLLPKPIAKHLEEIVEEPAITEGLAALLGKSYDTKVMPLWKQSVTVGFGFLFHSAFFSRNIYSGIYQNWLKANIWNPIHYYRGVKARLGRGTFKTAERGEITGAEMQDVLREQAVIGQPGMMDVTHEDIWERTFWQKIRDIPSWLMTETENFVRIAEFIKLAERMSFKESRDITYKTHFAYLSEFHTKFETKIMKRVFPFWTWMSRNIPFQIEQTLKHPYKPAFIGKLQQKLIEHYGMEEEYERRNEWQRNMFLIPNIFKRGKNKGWIGFGLPFTDLTTDLGDLYFALSPIKIIPELGYIEQDWGSDEYKTKKQKKAIERLAVGRYGSTAKGILRREEPIDKALYLMGMPTYEAAPEELLAEFEASRYKEPRPTKEQEYAAWVEAGMPENFRIKILYAPPGGMAGTKTMIPEPKWYQFWKKRPDKPEPPKFELLALPEELYEASKGFKPTPEQLRYILTGSEEFLPEQYTYKSPIESAFADEFGVAKTYPGAKEARYAELIAEWKAFKAGKIHPEQPTEKQLMESWERAGKPKSYKQKIYRDESGKLLGVLTFTPEELKELSGWTPSEAQKKWIFRETGAAKLPPIEQFKIWKDEFETKQEEEREWWKEYGEWDINAPVERRKYDGYVHFSAQELRITDERMARKEELEDLLGIGIDR